MTHSSSHSETHPPVENGVDPDLVTQDSSSYGSPRIGVARTASPVSSSEDDGDVFKGVAVAIPISALLWAATIGIGIAVYKVLK